MQRNWISRSEKNFFNKNGYLIIENALNKKELHRLNSITMQHTNGEDFSNHLDILALDPAFLQLTVNPVVLPKICGLLGWNIYVNHTHFNVRPPNESSHDYHFAWHSDGGTISSDVNGVMPLTAIKVGFYLTDLSPHHRGQTYIIPKSVTDGKPALKHLGEMEEPPPEAKPVFLKAGSALLFQQGTIHSQGSPNLSLETRRTVFIQWAYRWMQPVDTMTVAPLEGQVENPLIRQMLGFNKPRPKSRLSSFYYPFDEDLPLRREIMTKVKLGQIADIGPGYARFIANLLPFAQRA